MFRRVLAGGYGVLLLLTSCGGEGNPEPTPPIPPTPHSLAQQAYVKASNAEAFSSFGAALALDGDTLVVGAPDEDTGVQNGGAVYVFTRSGALWVQQASVRASNAEASDGFGRSVALAGDTLVVGAPSEDSSAVGINGNETDNGAIDSGAVYVFTRSGTTWTQQAYVKASNTQADDRFGRSVALRGDTLVVGAPTVSTSPNNSGTVYVFTRSNGFWSEQASLKASNAEAGDGFGADVALAGDTVVVGASSEDSSAVGINGNETDNGAIDSGAVYVFTRSGTIWRQQAYVKASNTGTGDSFGAHVALTNSTLVVSASSEDNSAKGIDHKQDGKPDEGPAFNSGAVYVFTRNGTTWNQQAYVKASNTGVSDSFGRSLALDDNTLAVGAWLEDSNATGVNGNGDDNSEGDSGAVYVFRRSGTTWIQQAYVKASNTDAADLFGTSVALGGGSVVVGAQSEASSATGINDNAKQGDNSAPQSGAVYVMQ